MSKTLTTNKLIASVKRKGSIPESQQTFNEEDFLAFANEEMDLGLIPHVLTFHEEYFVHTELVEIVPYVTRYAIPTRAVGNKLRELAYSDDNGGIFEMTQIHIDDLSSFQNNLTNITFTAFYVEGSDIVLMPDVGPTPTGFLRFSYYLRPNEIVPESRVAIINNISRATGIVTGTTVGPDAEITTSTPHGLITGDYVKLTNTGLLVFDGLSFQITVTSLTTFTLDGITGGVASTGNWFSYQVTVDNMPSVIQQSSELDLIQTNNPFKTLILDVVSVNMNIPAKIFTFDPDDLPSRLAVGDQIALAGETIVPQVPADLHSLLAQRVTARCLEALGDTQGLSSANAKLSEMEQKSGALLQSRVEGAPKKIVNRHSLLKRRRLYWR